MTAILSGTVRTVTSFYSLNRPGRSRWYLRLVVDQADGGAAFEATLDTGEGYRGLSKADAMRTRLKPGTHVEAHGAAIQLRSGPGDRAPLVLSGAAFVRGGEAPATRANHLPVAQLIAMAARHHRGLVL